MITQGASEINTTVVIDADDAGAPSRRIRGSARLFSSIAASRRPKSTRAPHCLSRPTDRAIQAVHGKFIQD